MNSDKFETAVPCFWQSSYASAHPPAALPVSPPASEREYLHEAATLSRSLRTSQND